jgi:hypothetical protein
MDKFEKNWLLRGEYTGKAVMCQGNMGTEEEIRDSKKQPVQSP